MPEELRTGGGRAEEPAGRLQLTTRSPDHQIKDTWTDGGRSVSTARTRGKLHGIETGIGGDVLAALIFGLIASVAAILTILFSALQTRALSRQTAISNGISAASAIYNSIERLHNIGNLVYQDPDLGKYFHEGAPIPAEGSVKRNKVLILAHMYADCLDYGLMIKGLAPEAGSYDCWDAYAEGRLASSPAIRLVVSENPAWWPTLVSHMRDALPPA